MKAQASASSRVLDQHRAVTASGSHTDSDKKNCSRCTAGSLDPVTGSPRSGRQRLVPVPRRQQPGQVLAESPPLRHMGEQVIETGPRTPSADPARADTPPAWSSLITGFELTRNLLPDYRREALIQRTTGSPVHVRESRPSASRPR